MSTLTNRQTTRTNSVKQTVRSDSIPTASQTARPIAKPPSAELHRIKGLKSPNEIKAPSSGTQTIVNGTHTAADLPQKDAYKLTD